MKKNNVELKSILISVAIVILLTGMVLFTLFGIARGRTKALEKEKQKALMPYDEVAMEVLEGRWGEGSEINKRLKEAGYDVDKVIESINKIEVSKPKQQKEEPTEVEVEIEPETEVATEYEEEYYITGTRLTPQLGVVYHTDSRTGIEHRETYYSQKVLPGGGLDIPGRHVADDGTVRDENNYICVAADWSFIPYGELVETSLGMGKVYDTGCDYGTVDIYVNW